MSSDRDGTHGSWATPGDDQPDAESAVETTGEFTIDYAPPALVHAERLGGVFPGLGRRFLRLRVALGRRARVRF